MKLNHLYLRIIYEQSKAENQKDLRILCTIPHTPSSGRSWIEEVLTFVRILNILIEINQARSQICALGVVK